MHTLVTINTCELHVSTIHSSRHICISMHAHTYAYIYIYIYIFMYLFFLHGLLKLGCSSIVPRVQTVASFCFVVVTSLEEVGQRGVGFRGQVEQSLQGGGVGECRRQGRN